MPQDYAEVNSMPNRYFNLTQDLDEFVCARIEGGRYADTNELVQAALRALAREERARETKHTGRRASVDDDGARHIAEIDVFRELWLNKQRHMAPLGLRVEPSLSEISSGL